MEESSNGVYVLLLVGLLVFCAIMAGNRHREVTVAKDPEAAKPKPSIVETHPRTGNTIIGLLFIIILIFGLSTLFN